MTDENEVKEALTSGVDLIGLIFAKSPRSVSQDKARSIVNVVRKYGERDKRIIFQKEISMLKDVNIKDGDDIDRSRYWYQRMAAYIRGTTKRTPLTVGVFQDHSAEEINDIIEITGIDVVQLHGNEDPDVIEHINAPCIKVLHIAATIGGGGGGGGGNFSDESVLAEAKRYASSAIALLLDTQVGTSSASGGTGVSFDWDLVRRIDIPVVLAGGLDEDNVLDALKVKGVIGVDASSGLELSAGKKDINKLRNYTN